MIYRLTYCNKDGVEARLDIIRGATTPIEVIEGTANPFLLSYKMDKPDKSGFFMTSSADISIFETPSFNIDNLKTSNETDIKVEYYINNVLEWTGFVIPDFFSKTIGSPATVEMVASDRLGALKGVTLENLPARISLRNLLAQSLAKTGLNLTLSSTVTITQGSINILDTEILSQRLTDTRGRNISCYDIVRSILVATNSTLRQRKGGWQLYNKLEHENLSSTVSFSNVNVGARRTIQPVASMVGVFHEFGGSKIYPEDYNFRSGASGSWHVNPESPTEVEAVITFDNRNVTGFEAGQTGGYKPIYGTNTNNPHMTIQGVRGPINYARSGEIAVPAGYSNEVNISFDMNASAPIHSFLDVRLGYSVYATKGEIQRVLTDSGSFDAPTVNNFWHWIKFDIGNLRPDNTTDVSTKSVRISGKLTDTESLDGWTIHIRIYAGGSGFAGVINFASINFDTVGDKPKGNLYKTEQGDSFTKKHDIETTVFADYITKGLNGFFYDYPVDDTSNLLTPSGALAGSSWNASGSADTLPLLQHVTRQKSKLFSIAHDILQATIDLNSFDPLATFTDCNSPTPRKYIIISATYDFLRSEVSVELEQALVNNSIQKRDYIYSYFGEGEEGISSVGGISGGGGGGGGSTAPSYWQLDENGNLYTVYNAYSQKELSAYGYGGSGGGGGGGSAEWNDILNKPAWIGATKPSYSWSEIIGKPSTFPPSAHTHPFTEITGTASTSQIPTLAISKISGLQTALNGKFNNPTGTTAQYLRGDGSLATFPTGGQGTVTSVGLSAPTGFTVSGSPVTSSGTLALTFTSGYSLPTTARQTAWDNHLIATNNPHGVTAGQVGAYALGSNVASATKLQTSRTIWGQSFDGTANVSGAITVSNVIFSAAGWAMVQVGTELQMQYNGVVKVKYTSTGKILAVDDIVAYS